MSVHHCWIFPTQEGADAAVSVYRSSEKRGQLDFADEVMVSHGGVAHDPEAQLPLSGFLFQITTEFK
jgi:hypothetical protein